MSPVQALLRARRAWLVAAVLAASATGALLAVNALAAPDPIAQCAFGGSVPGVQQFRAGAFAAAERYAAAVPDAAARPRAARVFAAAEAAYLYGFPLEIERATLKNFVRNEIVNVAALAGPDTRAVVSPNVDTAYSVAWIDLTGGPLVFDAPESGGRFYTIQFMDAYTNAFAYVGTGSTGTHAGAYAIVPPGWSGTLPAGVRRIDSPTNTVWLLGRTLVSGPADVAGARAVQEQYKLTPLTAWEAGTRSPSVTLDAYPPRRVPAVPGGPGFIDTLNQELQIDPPPPGDGCALAAMAPAGVSAGHPGASDSLTADLANIGGVTPQGSRDAAEAAAIDAGTASGRALLAQAIPKLTALVSRGNHGWAILTRWIGTYGDLYLPRGVIATNYLGANIPSQGIYPMDNVDVAGRPLDGRRSYTIHFPRGLLPPARAFWSLTVYGPDNFLYANSIDRYAIGDRTAGVVRGRDGSLTVYLQHDPPGSAAARANWLPVPAGSFHLILRLYQPAPPALDGRWKPAPVFGPGELLRPVLGHLSLSRGRVGYTDSQPASTSLTLVDRRGRVRWRATHRDRAGRNAVRFAPRHLAPGRYVLLARAVGSASSYDSAASRVARIRVGLR